MIGRRAQLPGELLYLSKGKVLERAGQLGIDTAWFERDVTVEGEARGAVPLLPGTGASGRVKVSARRVDPQPEGERAIESTLERVVRQLSKRGLADLDAGEEAVREGAWFRFHRRLRFGVGSDDSTCSVRALILVDQEPVEDSGVTPGLLMNGSPEHLRPPYRSDGLGDQAGFRSGSGTGHLFRWLTAAREAREKDEAADLDALEVPLFATDRPRDDPHVPVAMYNLFARDDWMSHPRFPQLMSPATCEGVARADLVHTWGQTAVVMGSPLYVRVQSLQVREDPPRRDARRSSGSTSRLFRRLSS